MNEREFKLRTKRLALEAIALVEGLPRGMTSQVLGKQLLRCATSVGTNYRAACRSKSPADMLAKLAIVEEEGDEAIYWLDLLVEAGIVPEEQVSGLRNGFDKIVTMIVASLKMLRARNIDIYRRSGYNSRAMSTTG
jgi:four helix bundle protein